MPVLAWIVLLVAFEGAQSVETSARVEQAAPAAPTARAEDTPSPDLQARVQRANELLEGAKQAQAAKDPAAAREKIGQATDALVGATGAETSNTCLHALFDIGAFAYRIGDLADARKGMSWVLACREKMLADDDPALMAARQALGAVLFSQGDARGAGELFEKVLATREKTLTEDDPDLQAARLNLAVVKKTGGELEAARVLEEKAVAAFEKSLPDDDPNLLNARGNLAITLGNMGDLRGARALQEKVLAACEKKMPDEDPALQAARASLASTLQRLGDLRAARALEEKVLVVDERMLPADNPSLSHARGNLASTLYVLGDLRGARVLQERVLATFERILPDKSRDLQIARMSLANTLVALGDARGARTLAEKSLAVFEQTLPEDAHEILMARMTLANLLANLGDLRGARALEEQIIAVLEKTQADDDPDLRLARSNLAGQLVFLGDIDGARALLERVLKSCAGLPEYHTDLQSARINLADARYMQGDLPGARALLAEALGVFEKNLSEDHEHFRLARRNMAWVLAGLEDHDGLAAALAALIRSARAGMLASRSASQREAGETLNSISSAFPALLSLSPLLPGSEDLARSIAEVVEGMRAQSARPPPALDTQADASLALLRDHARALRARLNDLVAGSGAAGAPEPTASEDVAELARERDRAEADVRAALVAAGRIAPDIDFGALALTLPEKTFAVGTLRYTRTQAEPKDIWKTPGVESVLVHVLDARGHLTRIELGPLAAITAAVTRWRAAIGKPLERGIQIQVDAGEEKTAGEALRQLVLDPILAVAKDADRLCVCSDDALFLVPLDALPLGSGVVGEKIAIQNEASFARLLAKTKEPSAEPVFLALGGIDYNAALDGVAPKLAPAPKSAPEVAAVAAGERAGPLGANWGLLAETREEATGLGELFKNTFGREPIVLTGKAATKSAFESRATGARFLHIATHGYFAEQSVKSLSDPESPHARKSRMSFDEAVTGLAPMTLCGLALAGANRGADALGRVPGILTAEELAGLDLSSCELAVLSACETNVGITRAGQGLQSLQAALHASGVRTAITSLWKVDDQVTRQLFEDFYARVWVEKQPKAQALWASKMALKKQGHAVRDWGGWVLSGDPR